MSQGIEEIRHFQKCQAIEEFPQLPRHLQKTQAQAFEEIFNFF